MNKPQKPSKTVEQPGSIIFHFDHTSNKVSIQYFNQWIKDNVPKGAFDVALTLDEDYDYSGEIMGVYLRIEYKTLVPNAHYKSQVKTYEKQLAEWKEQNGKR
jgi:hypothetical protein